MKFISRALGADHRRPGGHLQGPEAEPGTSGPRSPSASLRGSASCLLIFLQFPKKPNAAAGSGAQVSFPLWAPPSVVFASSSHWALRNSAGVSRGISKYSRISPSQWRCRPPGGPGITSLGFIVSVLCKSGVWERGSAVLFFFFFWSHGVRTGKN